MKPSRVTVQMIEITELVLLRGGMSRAECESIEDGDGDERSR